jgi:uncharacterized protein YcfJ
MKLSQLSGTLAGAIAVIAGGAGGYQMYRAAHSALVVSAKPVLRTVIIPRQECRDAGREDGGKTPRRLCTTVYDSAQVPDGYDVVYEYRGRDHFLHMDREPGDSLPVKDGKIVLAALAGSTQTAR